MKDDFSSLELMLNARLPRELIQLYEDEGDIARSNANPFRLMPIGEVMSTREDFKNIDNWNWHDSCAFWTDDNSNYALLYLAGPLVGKVWYLDHEEANFSPAHRTLSGFITQLRAAAAADIAWYEMPTDYFVPIDYYFHRRGERLPATDDELEDDLNNAEALRTSLKHLKSINEDDRRQLLFSVMGLAPPGAMARVVDMLLDHDRYVQERAVNILAIHRFADAVPQLAEIALRGRSNGVTAAINALGRIGTSECLAILLKCRDVRKPGYGPYIGSALIDCGCEAAHDKGHWRFRLPGESQWQQID